MYETLFIGTSDNIARGSMQSASLNNPGREPEIVQIEMSEAAESILTRKGGVLTVDFIKPLG